MNDGDVDVLARLKGPALAIFLAVGRGEGVVTGDLSALTGWGRGATYDALRRLAANGWIASSRRGCWELTRAGRSAWKRLLGGGEPWAGSSGPGVPGNGTAFHGGAGSLPEDGTKRGVPGNGKARRPVTRTGTAGGKKGRVEGPQRGTRSGTKRWKKVPDAGIKRPHEHEDEIHDDDKDNDLILINTLKKLNFFDAEEWLAGVDRELVIAWLRDLEAHPRPNPGGYLRRCVENGRMPRARGQDQSRAPCPVCGRDYFDDQGHCLVCDGLIKI